MRQGQSEEWYGGTEQRGQSGRDVLLTPEDQTIVNGDGQETGVGEQPPVSRGPGQAHSTDRDQRSQHHRGERKADPGEGERGKIA